MIAGKLVQLASVYARLMRVRPTDGHTDRQTDRQTDGRESDLNSGACDVTLANIIGVLANVLSQRYSLGGSSLQCAQIFIASAY